MTEKTIERTEYVKQKFCELASRTLAIERYLKYKKDIMQCSSLDRLDTIVKNMTEEICS